jgi:hypothetical protein
MLGTKTCTHCGAEKLLAEFYPNSNCKDGYLNQCRDCTLAAQRQRSPGRFKRSYATIPGRARHLFNGARTRATKKGLEFSIDLAWVESAIGYGVCQVTGLPFEFGNKRFAPSLDRIDCSQGYTPSNTRVVVWAFNCAKGDGSDSDLRKLMEALRDRGF